MKLFGIIVVLIAVLLIATALPFLPGRYDAVAVPLSGFARGLGLASLLLVPIGVLWLLYEYRTANNGSHGIRAGIVVAALGAGTLALLFATIFAVGQGGTALAVGILSIWGLVLWQSGRRVLDWARQTPGKVLSGAWALILTPCMVAGSQFALASPLTKFAWNKTMDGMAPLIADIERYRAANNQYPRSLFSEWCDYRPAVIGVCRYQYEPIGNAYSLAVEMPTFSFDSREFLLYNPSDHPAMTSHDADLLQRSAAELIQYRGYHSATPLHRAHWTLLSYD